MAGTGGGAAKLLAKHRSTIVRELDVAQVLPQLVQKGVFNYAEEREVLISLDARERTEIFIDQLSRKGLDAFHEFCIVLERSSPRLLTSFLVDSPGKVEYKEASK